MPPLSIIGWSYFTGLKNEGYDLHIIRGKKSPSLLDDVVFGEVVDEFNLTWYPRGNDKVKTEITAGSTDFAVTFVTTDTTTTRTNFGITIDRATGVITAGAPTGGATIHNFLLFASAKLASTGNTISTRGIRVHIHDRVRGCWLTPPTLSVYRGSPKQRFTVLAEFESDGQPDPPLIGDVSRLPGIVWSASPSAGITMGTTGEIGTTATTQLGPVEVTAKLPADYGAKEAKGSAQIVLGFDEQPQNHYQAMLRSGPGFARLAEVPNILLLSEGFQADQESDWDILVSNLLDDLAHASAFRPFDRFISSGSVNVWSLFLPSRERGSSVLPELRITPGQTTSPRTGDGIPRTRPNTKVLDDGSVFFSFGLPVRGDAPPVDPTAQTAAMTAKVKEWNLIRGSSLDPGKPGMLELWQKWAAWSGRTLADEHDTLLGLAFGARPNVSSDSVDRGAVYHPFRAKRKELNKLLAKVTDGDGPLIGHVWVPKPSGSTRDEAGKDESLVVALIGGGRSGGVEANRSVTSASIHSETTIPLEPVGDLTKTLQLKILPHDIPIGGFWRVPRIAMLQIGTIVHELGHAFGVGDEYVEPDFFGPINRGNSNAGFSNLTLESELKDAASAVGDKLVGDKVRWRWPRIANAAVLSAAPWFSTSSHSTEIVIPLRLGDKFKFKNDDVVFLRRRPLRGVVGTTHVVATPSVPLVVTSDSQVGNQIVVRTQDGSDLNLADFPVSPGNEPIIFFAVPPPAYAAARNEKFADITPLLVRDQITKTGLPLNRKDAGKCGDQTDDTRAQLVNVPKFDDPVWPQRRWVGLFDGGAQYPCAIFHPSPDCIMRQTSDSAEFCPVCRYLLVDTVDPSLHGDMDAQYGYHYVAPP